MQRCSNPCTHLHTYLRRYCGRRDSDTHCRRNHDEPHKLSFWLYRNCKHCRRLVYHRAGNSNSACGNRTARAALCTLIRSRILARSRLTSGNAQYLYRYACCSHSIGIYASSRRVASISYHDRPCCYCSAHRQLISRNHAYCDGNRRHCLRGWADNHLHLSFQPRSYDRRLGCLPLLAHSNYSPTMAAISPRKSPLAQGIWASLRYNAFMR